MRHAGGRPATAGIARVLDLRDYFDLGPTVGPLTDRIVFRADPPGSDTPSFRDLFRKAQVGVLKSATHYLPYGELVDLGVTLGRIAAPRTAALWDVEVHLCRNPPAAPNTRGEEMLGVSVEHFREADLLGVGADRSAETWDGANVDLHLSELLGDMALVIDINRLHPTY